ncbi:MAG: hypothetical protein ACR2KM_09450 [Gemmatimonadaceae bacterium]
MNIQFEPARDPEDLARLLVTRANSGDVDGMVALYEADAVLACPVWTVDQPSIAS